MSRSLFCLSCLDGRHDLSSVDKSEINDDDGKTKQHVPIGMRNDIVEQLQKRIFGLDGIHIVHLNDVSCPIQNFIFDAVAVQSEINEVNDGVDRICDRNGGNNALHVFFDKLELEHQHGNADFEQMREEVKREGQAENFEISLRGIDNQSEQSTEAPENQEIVQRLVSCPDGDRQNHCVQGTKMKRQIFNRRIPNDEIEDDRGDSRKGQNAEYDGLNLL